MSQERPQQVQMDPEQLKKMTERLSADLRAVTKRLEAADADKERLSAEKTERDVAFEKLNRDMDVVRGEKTERDVAFEKLNRDMAVVRDEKKRNFSELVETDVKPFFQNLKKDQDPRVVENVSIVEQQIANGLDDAFMNKNDMALFQTVRACASSLTATSQELEKMFQSEREWTAKFNTLRDEKEANEAKAVESTKLIESERALKEKALDDLKEELAKLKAVHTKNLAAVENHFEADAEVAPGGDELTSELETRNSSAPANSAAVPIESSTTIRAEASNRTSKFYGGFETLFDFQPRTDWRNHRRDDGF
jgi:hypothetical protein